MSLKIVKITVGILSTNCYIVYDEKTSNAIVIDPGDVNDQLFDTINKLGLKLIYVLATHGHFDHVGGVKKIIEVYKARFCMNFHDINIMQQSMNWLEYWGLKPELPPNPDVDLSKTNEIYLSNTKIQVIQTPGHTSGSVVFYIPEQKVVFTGDLLFSGSVGRTDLPGGSEIDLILSLRKLYELVDIESLIYPGHGPETTMQKEMIKNVFVRRALSLN